MGKNTRKIEATTKLRIQKLNDRKEVHKYKTFYQIQNEFNYDSVRTSIKHRSNFKFHI